jgi:hypothetical protein
VNVNPLVVETPEEKRLYALGERNSQVRKERRNTSLLKHTPNDLESDLIHAFWQKQLQYHGELLGMSLENLLIRTQTPTTSYASPITLFPWM